MVNFSTLVRGDGIAARCCEFLLQQTTIPVGVERESRVPIPALLLGDAALALLRDVFQQPDLLEDAWKIQRRIVAWNPSIKPVELPHSAVVVSERALLEQVVSGPNTAVAADGGMTIYSGRQLPAGLMNHAFGSRMASSAAVVLVPEMAGEICAIEAVAGGWLFLVPTSRESGWLLTVGGGADSLLGESRLISGYVKRIEQGGNRFPAYPRIISPLCGDGWIACGSAAMAFDPICGDGTAHAVREGILATAVIRAIAEGGDVARLCRHYEARLIGGFQRHLELCRTFYRTGFGGEWWDEELAGIERGLAWCAEKMAAHGAFRYRLNGFELEELP